MTLLRSFDSIRVISLASRLDRRQEMAKQLASIGLVPGQGGVSFFDAVRPHDGEPFGGIGVKGCFLSHLEVLREAARDGTERLLVIEDDLSFSSDFSKYESGLKSVLESRAWNICYLGHNESVTQSSGLTLQEWTEVVWCAHFYAVTKATIPRLIGFLELLLSREPGDPRGGPMHYDGALCTFREQNPDIVTVLASPSLGYQRSSPSDITRKWFDRIPLFAPLLAFVRRFKKPRATS